MNLSNRQLTKRALDRWDSAAFSSIFLASGFSCSQAESTPAHLSVTQTVRQKLAIEFRQGASCEKGNANSLMKENLVKLNTAFIVVALIVSGCAFCSNGHQRSELQLKLEQEVVARKKAEASLEQTGQKLKEEQAVYQKLKASLDELYKQLQPKTNIFSLICIVFLVMVGFAYFVVVGYHLIWKWKEPTATAIRENGPSILGLPLAALGSFILVIVLPAVTDSPLKFKGFTVELEGSSSQIMFWVICFLVFVGAIKMLRPPNGR